MPIMDFGIDFGTSRVVIYAPGKGVLLDEPTVMAIDTETGKMFACGTEAYIMQGRAPASITVIRPLAKGVIADFESACLMLRYFVHKVCAYKIIKPRVVVSVPASVTAVEQRAFSDAVYAAGARQVMLIEKSMAAAIGAGLDIRAARGSMVVAMGAGTTDVAVVSLKGISASASKRVAGDALDDAIIRYVRQKYQLVIGNLTAEQLKREIGAAFETISVKTTAAKGRDAVSGLPRIYTLTTTDILEAMREPLTEIVGTISRVLENTPPELASDIYDNGIILTGGLAQLRGMAERIESTTGVHCLMAEEPAFCVAKGAAASLQYISVLHSGVYDIGKFSDGNTDALTN